VNTTLIAMGIACLVVVGLIVNLGVLSLLSGAFHFLFGQPKFDILKSEGGDTSFAFGFRWNNAREPAKFDKIRLRLFNPFGSPSQVDVVSEFGAKDSDFGADVNFGPGFKDILSASGLDNSTMEIEVVSQKSGITHYFKMKTRKFLETYRAAEQTATEFNDKHGYVKTKPVYQSVTQSFIADAIPESDKPKALRIASNPMFAAEFAAGAGAGEAAVENFSVAKVWIEDGCIVCNACEGIFPEVFDVTEDNCVIRPDAPLIDGLKILEAAEACPTEVIKFDKAN